MRTHRALPLFFLALLHATPAFAADTARSPAGTTAPTTVAATDRARSLHIEGAKLYDEGKYEQAYVAFVAAWALKKHPQIAGNLADCEMKLGKYRDAADHYRFITRNVAGDVKPEDQARAEGRLKEAQQKIAVVEIATTAAGAEVSLDGTLLGKAPLPDALFLEPGQHTIEAHLDGYASAIQKIDATAGSSRTVRLEMTSSSGGPKPPVVSTGPSPVLIIVSGVLAAGGIAAGIGFTTAANGASSDADTLGAKLPGRSVCTGTPGAAFSADCTTVKNDLSRQSTMTSAALASFVAGGAFTLAAVGLGVWGLKTSPTKVGLQVAPIVGAREGGVIIGGVW